MGEVYLAEEVELGRKVALKLLPPELTGDERFRERFLRESRLAASLNHPHVVPVYRAGEADGVLFIAMHYVQGTDLRSLLKEHPGGLEPGRAVSIVEQIADALDAAHARGLIHRDVKPANVLIARGRRGDHCYLADFGLTRYAGSQSRLTETGQFVGTVDYVAPEQVRADRTIDHRVDIYSLGCVLFECLTGAPPYQGPTDFAVMWAHVNNDPPAITGSKPELPEELDGVVLRALAKEPDERFGSAGDLAAAARTAVSGKGVASKTWSVTRPRIARRGRRGRLRTAWIAAAAGLAALLAATLAVVLIGRDGSEPPAFERGTFNALRLGPQLSEGAWRTNAGLGREGRTAKQLRVPGRVVEFRSTLVGMANSSALVSWSVQNAQSARVVGPGYRNKQGAILLPAATNDTSEGDIWVPLPPAPGRFFITVRLTHNGRLLARAETSTFAGRPKPTRPKPPPAPPPPPSGNPPPSPPPPPPVVTIIG
jgi:Protein kinase domain